MLDQETKKKINNLRDTLVGKVPDPKSQVEQIMIALIYKFMNDMDKESTDLGGEASFFVGDFEKYSWDNLFGTKVSGSELVDLYSTAVESMEENPNIPQLFRDIFKNAYIPYKDAETLRLFLSQIDDFEYSKDSEQLGDAFEHILNSLSSQGDAGQFRTPRHIIDFIVEIVDPKKDETVLDPASGTSGFLISAFKHIVSSNSEKSSGDLLSATERKKIMKNINGYDISPDMVRIGLANMYLHGFPEPNVVEYDALTSEDRWNEYYDVILANPPFMTPKGGIRPHNKFGLKSNRAEVLFVDYILTHLKPKGRAGIIVPDGIIFKTDNAYKELRKKLLENGLIGVVSLPAGVFNPYSGVKTSILLIDKTKQVDEIIFADVNSDGFSLGANRNKIDNNDLPLIKDIFKNNSESELAIHIEKEKILENENLLFTVNSYLTEEIISDFNIVSLGEVAEVYSGNPAPQDPKSFLNGVFPFFRTSDVGVVSKNPNLITSKDLINEETAKSLKISKRGSILFPKSGASTLLNHRSILGIDGYVSSHLAIIESDDTKINFKFLYYLLCQTDARVLVPNIDYPSLKNEIIKNIKIPLPPLEKQLEILDEIERYQKVIDGASQVVENYFPKINIDSNWELINFEESCKVLKPMKKIKKTEMLSSGKFPVIDQSMKFISGYTNHEEGRFIVTKPLIIFGDHTRILKFVEEDFYPGADGVKVLEPLEEKFLPKYFFYILKNIKLPNLGYSRHFKELKNVNIPCPSIDLQKEIVIELDKDMEVLNQNEVLIENLNSRINSIINSLYK